MQWNACLLRRSAVVLLFSLGCGRALAIPAPPQSLQNEGKKNDKDITVRVLLGTHARFSVSGDDLLVSSGGRLKGSSAFNLRCGSESSGAAYVEFGAGRRALGQLDIASPSGTLRVNDRQYRGRVSVISKGTHCLVVNSLGLERYVAAVIGKEMSPSWPLEALKAQAVASRSYALYQMRKNRSRDYDLESSTQDQVYEGASGETTRTLQAAEATRATTLAYRNETLKAYFHANCGGKTEVPSFVWGGEGKAFRTVACPYHERQRDRQRWQVMLTAQQIEGALKKIAGVLPQGFRRLASLAAGAPNPSQRLSDLEVADAQGHSLLVSANAFRNAIGNTKLKSTAFQVRQGPSGYIFEGEGHGHGVGLCQVGARAMAEEGRSYMQILRFYYPLAQILRVL